jgi:hypothetical protein
MISDIIVVERLDLPRTRGVAGCLDRAGKSGKERTCREI